MKRFYNTVDIETAAGGWAIRLDERPVRTPARAHLVLPTEPLADAVAGEWRAQGEEIDPTAMPLTGLANAAIDIVKPDPAAFAAPLAGYGGSDLLCYRAPESDLAEAQAEVWDPLIAWAEDRYGVAFVVTSGIVPVAQPEATLATLHNVLGQRTAFRLAALSPMISIGGSLIAALALDERAFPTTALWQAVTLDERWQEERWGTDAEATAARALRQRDWDAAARFLGLLGND
jgi:chaperone required for assembly of F1-ATPase